MTAEPAEREGPTGLERIVFFSDAVVAIAITLIILPLVDKARELGQASGLDFVRDNASDLRAAGISFGVISAFWIQHHHLFDRASRGAPHLITINLFWLAGIMALPVATVLDVGSRRGDRSAYAIYVGTILFLMIMSRVEDLVLARAGSLGEQRLDRRLLIDDAVPVVLLMIALGIGLAEPTLGTLPLLLLLLSPLVHKLVYRGTHPEP